MKKLLIYIFTYRAFSNNVNNKSKCTKFVVIHSLKVPACY